MHQSCFFNSEKAGLSHKNFIILLLALDLNQQGNAELLRVKCHFKLKLKKNVNK